MDRQKWGLAGLLAFEAIVTAYLLGVNNGWPSATQPALFVISYALGAAILGLALWKGPARWHFALLAVAAAYRAFAQMDPGTHPGVYPTWLVPLGFAWLALAPERMPRIAIALVALARTWFVAWYVPDLFFVGAGSWTLVVANVLGAAGAWLWLGSDEPAIGEDRPERTGATP